LAGFAAVNAVEKYGRPKTRNNNVGRSARSRKIRTNPL
jgi:hypothetical protein